MTITKEEYKELRKSVKLTRPQLAEKLGTTETTIYRRETGMNPITRESEFAMREIVRREKQLIEYKNSKHA